MQSKLQLKNAKKILSFARCCEPKHVGFHLRKKSSKSDMQKRGLNRQYGMEVLHFKPKLALNPKCIGKDKTTYG